MTPSLLNPEYMSVVPPLQPKEGLYSFLQKQDSKLINTYISDPVIIVYVTLHGFRLLFYLYNTWKKYFST